jgi:hypothetical protein
MRCVALCTSIGQLTIGFLSSLQFSSDDRIVCWKLKYMAVLSLTIGNICPTKQSWYAFTTIQVFLILKYDVFQTCCDHWMSLLGGLSNIVVRKMRETGKASTLYGDVSRSGTGLLEVAWRKSSVL